MPQPGLNGRRGYQPRGKTLGGSSSINAMLYVRGNKRDYDHWAALGNPGWSYDDVLPLFKRSRTQRTIQRQLPRTGRAAERDLSAFPEPAQRPVPRSGSYERHPAESRLQRREQEGAFLYQVTHINGERCSAAKAYLTPNLSRPNLQVLTDAVTAKVNLDGRRATGVSYYQGNELKQVHARREVILSSGTFGSPQLLMLSGIGDANELQKFGIPVVHQLPGVGKNLQDHLDYVQAWRVPNNTASFGISMRGVAQGRCSNVWSGTSNAPA